MRDFGLVSSFARLLKGKQVAIRRVALRRLAQARRFDSRLNCLLRPNAGATYFDASLRMTDFGLVS
jgi:hypothetical protein